MSDKKFSGYFNGNGRDTSDFGVQFVRLERTYTEKNNHVFLNDPSDFADPYEQIQANSVGTDIYEIIGRALNGDTSVDFSSNWSDADYSLFTLPLIDMQEKLNSAKRLFKAMPLDVRERYGNDFEQFACNYSFDSLNNKSSQQREDSPSNGEESRKEVE